MIGRLSVTRYSISSLLNPQGLRHQACIFCYMAVPFGYMRMHFCIYTIATLDLTKKADGATSQTTSEHQNVCKSIFSNKFCNKIILQSNDKDLLRCYIKQIMNIFLFIEWCLPHRIECLILQLMKIIAPWNS